MTRKCSHCSHNGHNSRTCPNRGGGGGGGGLKLFGVQLTGQSIRKSASMGNLNHYSSNSNFLNNPGSPGSTTPDHGPAADDGYGSEDFVPGSSSSSRERKKGVPWTEEEHRMFLLGLHKLGKGDWRGISRNFVISRTPTQVASHAQKYFIRQTNMSKRKRRSSLFDIVADESVDTPMESHDILPINNDSQDELLEINNNPLPAPPSLDEECESMNSTTNSIDGDPVPPNPDISQNYQVLCPTYVAPFFPFSFPLWPVYTSEETPNQRHEVLKPTAIHSKTPINVDELVSMSKLSLGESIGLEGLGSRPGPSSISLKLDEGSTRQSAFHANPTADNSSVNAC